MKVKLDYPKMLVFFIAISFAVFVFHDAIISYFSQDDFFHLRQIMNLQIQDLPRIFVPKYSEEQTFYRPVSRELYNFVVFNLFGLNALIFHLLNFSFILLNSFLGYVFIKQLAKEKLIALIFVIIYLLSAVHSIELYYLASIQTLLATSFVLITLIGFLKFLKTGIKKYWVLSWVSFVLAIGAHESSIVLLAFIFLLSLYFTLKISKSDLFRKSYIKKLMLTIFPFAVIVLARLWIHFMILGLPEQEVYKPIFSVVSMMNSFVWFTLWNFGFPEMMTDFMTLTLQVNPNLYKWYGDYIKILMVCFVGMIGVLSYVLIKSRNRIFKSPVLLLLVVFYIISLSPFLFFPFHKFVYYLTLSVIWFSAIMAFCVTLLFQSKEIRNKIVGACCIALFAILSFNTIQLNKITHWSAKRALAAEFIINDAKQKFPSPKAGTIFYIKDDANYPMISSEWGTSSKQAFYILSGSDAFQLVYQNLNIKVFFEAVEPLPENINMKNVLIYTPIFPY